MGRKHKGVMARGESIQIAFMYQGERCRETLRIPPTRGNLELAARKRAAAMYAIEMGTFDYAEHFPHSKHALRLARKPASLITLDKALKDWLRRQETSGAASTIRDYTSAVYHHLIPRFGGRALDGVEANEIRDWMASLPISAKRINNVLIPLRGVYSEAFCDGILDRDPLQRIRNIPPGQREPRPFTKAEVTRILAQLEGQNLNLIEFAFATGLRTSELIGLRWEDVALADKKIHIRRAIVRNVDKEPKTASGRRSVELDAAGQACLHRQADFTLGKSPWVFHDPRTDQRWQGDGAIRKRVWTPALEAAAVSYRNPYQTRHTFVSKHLTDRKNPMWVAHQLGHRDWGMIRKIYGRWLQA